MELEDIYRIECNRCGAVTFHDRLTPTKTLWGVTDEITGDEIPGVGQPVEAEGEWPDDFSWCETFSLLKCRGCHDVCLEVQRFEGHALDAPITRYHPPRLFRRRPQWFRALPSKLSDLLNEVYAALAADSPRLAAMGVRAAMDMVLTDTVGDDEPNFFKKLEKLEEQGLIGGENREQLAAALDVGHAAAHRSYAPPLADLGHILDILENLLVSAYKLKDVAAGLRKRTPRRYPHAVHTSQDGSA